MKCADYSNQMLPQETIDNFDDLKTIVNFGKYQTPIVRSLPGWIGRAGETVYYFAGATGALYVCTSDQSATSWRPTTLFYL